MEASFPKALRERILTTIRRDPRQSCELLMGHWEDTTVNVVGAFHCTSTDVEDVKHGYNEALGHFPAGFSVCGLYVNYSSAIGQDVQMRNIREICAGLRDVLEVRCLLVCTHHIDTGPSDRLDETFWYHLDARETSPTCSIREEVDRYLWEKMVMFRIRSTYTVVIPYHQHEASVKAAVSTELAAHIDAVVSSETSFHITASPILLHNDQRAEKRFLGISESQPCSDILSLIDHGDDRDKKMNKKRKNYGEAVINVEVLQSSTSSSEKSAFYIYAAEKLESYMIVPIPLDVVALVQVREPVGNLPALFTGAVRNQLLSLGRCMCMFYKDKKMPEARPFHIRPLDLDHVLTVYYPNGFAEDDLTEYRKALHVKLNLQLDRPLLRTSNQFTFSDEIVPALYLRNTHVGLPSSGVKNGSIYCVQGVYSYHHYMQDGMDDNGWGCAYRSLQTIVSWFRHQGYTHAPVPTHAQIQQALVDLGDKQLSFVGSKKWIGSTEVGFCLDHLLGVASRFLTVSAGSQLVEKGRELAQHFTVQGTPIMIGGGVLAHTILGVDFNEITGELKFLILDPHYTGQENINEIQSKGWCGWKGPEFWEQTAFYNLCMPQRPSAI